MDGWMDESQPRLAMLLDRLAFNPFSLHFHNFDEND